MKNKLDKSYGKLASIFTRELLEATLPSIVLILIALVIAYKKLYFLWLTKPIFFVIIYQEYKGGTFDEKTFLLTWNTCSCFWLQHV